MYIGIANTDIDEITRFYCTCTICAPQVMRYMSICYKYSDPCFSNCVCIMRKKSEVKTIKLTQDVPFGRKVGRTQAAEH